MTEPKLDLLCRPATAGDTPEMMELTRLIWDGEDYVPLVWAGWLKDPHGRLAVAEIASGEHAGRVVGLGKLTRLGPSDWWLEGLRTHPQFEGRGVASALYGYLMQTWLNAGRGTLRLATSSTRFAIHHLSERSGLIRVGEFSSFQAVPSAPDRQRFRALSLPEAAAALDFARRSPSLALSGGLIDLSWQWMAPDLAQVEAAARRSMAWWWQPAQAGDQGLLLLSEDREAQDGSTQIELLACPLEAIRPLLDDFRRLAGALGYRQATWAAPLHPVLLPVLQAAGFQRVWDGSVYIFARLHPTRP